MTIAIQRNIEGEDTVFFDAVLSFSESYQGRLTTHPIDSAGKFFRPYANDHVVIENPTFFVKGVFSSADFGAGRPNPDEFPLLNDTKVSGFVEVKSSPDSMFSSIAGSLLPFGTSAEPEVSIGTLTSYPLPLIKLHLTSIFNNRETVTLVEFRNGQAVNWEFDLVITSLQFNEDANTGDSLPVEITLQRANYVDLVSTKVSSKGGATSGKLKNAATSTVDKGPQTKTTTNLKDLEDRVIGLAKKFSERFQHTTNKLK